MNARDIAIDARGVEDCSMKGADDRGVPPVDHGSTRYSAVSGAVFAANVTQPESLAGSMELYAPTASASCDPCAPQDGRVGPAASLLLQALVRIPPMNAKTEIRVFQVTCSLRRRPRAE